MRKLHNDPILKLEGSEISVVEQHKFLCMVYDKKTILSSLKEPENKMQPSIATIMHSSQ